MARILKSSALSSFPTDSNVSRGMLHSARVSLKISPMVWGLVLFYFIFIEKAILEMGKESACSGLCQTMLAVTE